MCADFGRSSRVLTSWQYAEISGEAEARDAATNTSLSLAVRGHGLRMLGVGFTTLVLSQVEDPALVPIVTTGVFTVLWAIRAFAIYY